MKAYVGLKQVNALPMTRGDYNHYRGWETPDSEENMDEGYLVEYVDGGAPNHPNHGGYISWCPAEQFEKAYRPQGDFGFEHALYLLKQGYPVGRAGWNGKNMFLLMVENGGVYIEGTAYASAPQLIMMKTADDMVVPWLCSVTDMVAEDWQAVELVGGDEYVG